MLQNRKAEKHLKLQGRYNQTLNFTFKCSSSSIYKPRNNNTPFRIHEKSNGPCQNITSGHLH